MFHFFEIVQQSFLVQIERLVSLLRGVVSVLKRELSLFFKSNWSMLFFSFAKAAIFFEKSSELVEREL